MKIGDMVFIHGYIDEIRKDTVIIRNKGGYFGTIQSEVICGKIPERKTGRWISVFDEDEDKCSECQAAFFCASTRFDFCPNCGADMRGKQP